MATYVFSDVHGHLKPLDRALDRISPSAQDKIFCLGDMIDRGPDGIEVAEFCRRLAGCKVLMGNHEQIMVDYMANPDEQAQLMWNLNGGSATYEALCSMDNDRRIEFLNWCENLSIHAHVQIEDRFYILTHAGLNPKQIPDYDNWDSQAIEEMLSMQQKDDLLWIREDFWCHPTGLIDSSGQGPVVVSGHTPTPMVGYMCDTCLGPAVNEDNRCQMLECGACLETSYKPDKLAIDCGAASGFDTGRILILRLEDGLKIYENIGEDE